MPHPAIFLVALQASTLACAASNDDVVAVLQTELRSHREHVGEHIGENASSRFWYTWYLDENLPGYSKQQAWRRSAWVLPVVMVGLIALSKARGCLSLGKVSSWKVLEFVAAIALFALAGPAVIILNKYIMRDQHFHFPVLLASLGNLLMMLVTRGAVLLGATSPNRSAMDWQRYCKVVVLMASMNFAVQVLGMWAYLFISVPEIQILKSVTVIIVMLLTRVVLKEPVSPLLVLAVLVIAGGTVLSATVNEGGSHLTGSKGSAQIIGVLLCIAASFGEATKTICSQLLMDSLSVFEGLYWSSPVFTAIAVIVVAALELRRLLEHPFTPTLGGLLLLNAALTSLIVVASFWVVKLVGALALKVLTQARTVGLVLVSVAFFGERCSPMEYLGYAVSLLGIGMFDKAKGMLKEQADLARAKK